MSKALVCLFTTVLFIFSCSEMNDSPDVVEFIEPGIYENFDWVQRNYGWHSEYRYIVYNDSQLSIESYDSYEPTDKTVTSGSPSWGCIKGIYTVINGLLKLKSKCGAPENSNWVEYSPTETIRKIESNSFEILLINSSSYNPREPWDSWLKYVRVSDAPE